MPAPLIILVAIHVVLGCLPFCFGLVPPDVRYMPIIWLLGSITVAQVMLLAFWAGMGANPPHWRLIGTLVGCAYLGMPAMVVGVALQALVYGGILVLLSCVFLGLRRWFVLEKMPADITLAVPGGFQFSIFHLLVLTSAAAVLLGLVRSARLAASVDSSWFTGLMWALMLATLAINAVSSAFATLALYAWRSKLIATCLVSLLLGLAICLATYRPFPISPPLPWWVRLNGVLITTYLTLIIVLTLLVVRSCGFRIVLRALIPSQLHQLSLPRA